MKNAWDELTCHHMHTKFHKDWFSHSEVNRGDSQTHREHGDCISLLSFFSLHSFFLNRAGLLDHVAVRVCVCLHIPLLTFEHLNQSLWNLARTYITAPAPALALRPFKILYIVHPPLFQPSNSPTLWMKCSLLPPSLGSKNKPSKNANCYVGFLLGLFLNPEDGGDMLFRDVGWLSTDYMALYRRR
jgi:hypothetical protein